MAKKDLIIGAYTNYKFNLLKPWIYSIKQSGFDGDIVLIAVDADEETVQQIQKEGVIVVRAKNEQKMMIHMLRFLYIYNHLKTNTNYRYVITTDVRDVIFQSNPSIYLQKVFGEKVEGVVAQSEAIKIKDETWNRENIIKNFGPYFYEHVKENNVYNVGILAGTAEYMKDLCFTLFQMSSNRPDWVADQATYNMLINYMPWSNVIIKLNLSDAWAINAHVTNMPGKEDEFGPFLLEPRPTMQDGVVVNSQGKPFVIVHQYDRVPEWMEYFMKKYEFSVNSDTDTGTSPKYFLYNS